MKDYKNIPMPTEQEKERSIQWILDNGLPQKESFGESLSELWHSIGVRGLFFGVEDSSLLALFITILAVGYLYGRKHLRDSPRNAAVHRDSCYR